MTVIQAEAKSEGMNVVIVISKFYDDINSMLLDATCDGLRRNGVNDDEITVIYAPGALEIPLIVQKCAEFEGKYDAIIALGTVIRGETAHFDYVSKFSVGACAQIGLDYDIPVINGILTVENREQALDRADAKRKNKGGEFAEAAIEMVNLSRMID